MANKFGNAWYVRKDRIQLFLPLDGNLHFEIDKTGLGEAIPNETTSGSSAIPPYRSYDFGTSSVKCLDFPGSSNGFTHLSLTGQGQGNGDINTMISSIIYRAGGKCTIVYWSRPSSDNVLDILGVQKNTVFSDVYAEGYSFGVETHTSLMDPSVVDQTDVNYKYHILTALNSVTKTRPSGSDIVYKSELEDYVPGPNVSTLDILDIPSGQWIMTTIVLDNSNSENFKSTIHLRWYNNGIPCHYWKTNTNMGKITHDNRTLSVVNKTDGVWTIGCTLTGGDRNPDKFFIGGLRNIMLYNVELSTEQQDTIFSNGIDPYIAPTSKNTDDDEDQYDERFWGKYGIMANGSGVKVEKCIFGNDDNATNVVYPQTSVAVKQNKKRFAIASRDGSTISVSRDDVISGDTANPTVIDTANENSDGFYNSWSNSGLATNITAAAWRGGSISGDRKLDIQRSRSIWGGVINGISDMMRIESTIDPITLPAGKYITTWDVRNNSGLTDANYPEFLPRYYYRDRLGRSWRKYSSTGESNSDSVTNNGATSSDEKYVSDIFWTDGIKRYEKVAWVKPRVNGSDNVIYSTSDQSIEFDGFDNGNEAGYNGKSDEFQIDQASNWESIYWSIAIYEIEREQTLDHADDGTTKYGNKIKLTLIDHTGKYSAVYYKYRRSPLMDSTGITDGTYGGWQFESFIQQQSNSPNGISVSGEVANEYDKLASEFIRRIYLPHMTIPHLTIPWLRDKINVQSVDLATDNNSYYNAFYAGSIMYCEGFGVNLMMVNGSNGPTVVAANRQGWKPPQTGWYEAIVCFGTYGNDSNISSSFSISGAAYGGGTVTGRTHSRVGGGYTVSWHMTSTLHNVFYAKSGASIRINISNANDGVKFVIIRLLSASTIINDGKMITNVEVLEVNSEWNSNENKPVNAAYDPRYAAYTRENIENGIPVSYIELEGIAVKYTRENKIGINPSGASTSATHVPINQTLTNVTESPYENDAENNNKNGRGA